MTLPQKQSLESLIVKLSLTAAGVVLLFSAFNAYSLLTVALRTVFSFFLIYLLGIGFMGLWEKFTPPPPENNYGSKIDIILGDIIAYENDGEKSPDQQEHTEPEGTYSKIIPGQINIDMQNGLPDEKNKAEIVKRMGLKE